MTTRILTKLPAAFAYMLFGQVLAAHHTHPAVDSITKVNWQAIGPIGSRLGAHAQSTLFAGGPHGRDCCGARLQGAGGGGHRPGGARPGPGQRQPGDPQQQRRCRRTPQLLHSNANRRCTLQHSPQKTAMLYSLMTLRLKCDADTRD